MHNFSPMRSQNLIETQSNQEVQQSNNRSLPKNHTGSVLILFSSIAYGHPQAFTILEKRTYNRDEQGIQEVNVQNDEFLLRVQRVSEEKEKEILINLKMNTELQSVSTMTDQIITTESPVCNGQVNTIGLQLPNLDKDQRNYQAFNHNFLISNDQQQNFQICDDEAVNIGRTSTNLQLKESFNILRHSIQKILNEQQFSLADIKLLPSQLEDDFLDFVSYIKQKVQQLKKENNLTFIMAQNGYQLSVEEIEAEMQEFLLKPSSECITLKKIIEQKDCTINSLMNQKTEQQNTINEQQTAQEQTERLYLQQFSVLKKEIQQQKQTIDTQIVCSESIKNFIKRTMNLWLDDQDNYEDFEDNLKMITTIYKFSQKEMELLHQYLQKYKILKNIQ